VPPGFPVGVGFDGEVLGLALEVEDVGDECDDVKRGLIELDVVIAEGIGEEVRFDVWVKVSDLLGFATDGVGLGTVAVDVVLACDRFGVGFCPDTVTLLVIALVELVALLGEDIGLDGFYQNE
jgi:hypothetical protein